MKKISYMEAAERFVANQFPSCEAAILAGSVVQGGATETSDLDIVILDESGPGPFRRTYKAFGWVIEAFVLTKETYRYFFDQGIDVPFRRCFECARKACRSADTKPSSAWLRRRGGTCSPVLPPGPDRSWTRRGTKSAKRCTICSAQIIAARACLSQPSWLRDWPPSPFVPEDNGSATENGCTAAGTV